MKIVSKILFGIICASMLVSCSVRTHRVIADYARSGEAILIKLENPTLCKVDSQWYMKGNKTSLVRRHRPCILPSTPTPANKHLERYYLVDPDENNFEPVYAPIPETMAMSIQGGTYTHSDAISFINSNWSTELPAGNCEEVTTHTRTPEYFRNMSSHRLVHTEENSYLIARVDEMTADFNAIYMYPVAGLSAIFIDFPGTLLLGPGYEEEE